MEPRPVLLSRLGLRLKDDKSFKTAMTLVLAGLTFVTSLIVISNVRASARGSAAGRDSRILGLRYVTQINRAQWAYAADYDTLSFYKELTGSMDEAEVSSKHDFLAAGDTLFFKLTKERLDKIRKVLAAEGELTRPPYFNPQSGEPDVVKYLLDRTLIPATEILERQEQKKAESGFWGSKADAYTAALAIMAVAAFLLTLSLVLGGKIRFFMAGAGLVLAAAVISMSAATSARSWSGLADESIRQYARAYWQTGFSQLVYAQTGNREAALASLGASEAEIDKILAREPQYRSAIRIRSRIHESKGETLFYSGQAEESRPELEMALADLDVLIRTGPADGYLYWSRGYVEYLLGREAASFERDIDQALKLLPAQGFALGANRAVALLSIGKVEAANIALDEAIEFALRKPLASDALSFRVIIHNLERIQDLKRIDGLQAFIRRLKEAAVSLAVLKKSRPLEEHSVISPPRFGNPVFDKWDNITDFNLNDQFPKYTAAAYFLLDLKGVQPGQSMVRKVYSRSPGLPFWIEEVYLSQTEYFKKAAEGDNFPLKVEMPIPDVGQFLPSGNYRIEIYIDGNLKSTGFFTVL
jgi:tetratricopeptide (TPR) repeat protein